ncbi:MAG: hypothetical protein HFJ75_00290 [Eggerthellaceae bacterium]|nr:hypothetical protein [Eggerthellaceae bacterium]
MDKREFAAAIWSLSSDVTEDPNETLGILTFEGDQPLELEIPAGVLLDWPKIPIEGGGYVQSHTAEGLQVDQVYGFSQRGDYYLLRDVSTPGPGMSCPGMERQTLRGMSLFVSREALIPNPVVRSMKIRVPGLREWLGTIPFKISVRYNENRSSNISFSYDAEDADPITLFESDNIKIDINLLSIRKGGPIPTLSFYFETDCEMTISFKGDGFEFNYAMETWAHRIVGFLAFCMGFKYPIKALSIETIDGIKADYYAPFVGAPGVPTSLQLQSMPFTYSRISEKIGSMIQSWLEFDDYLRNSAALLTSLMTKWSMPLDMLFLASAQAFEAASRSRVDECEISDEKLEDRLRAIKESELSSRIKHWACYKLKHAKWKPASRLAEDLVGRLGDFAIYVTPDTERFLNDHRVHRNAYTHRRSLIKGESLSNKELYCHMEAVQLLTYGAIAMNLGQDIADIVACFKDSRYRWNSIYRSRKQYAVRP